MPVIAIISVEAIGKQKSSTLELWQLSEVGRWQILQTIRMCVAIELLLDRAAGLALLPCHVQ